MNRIKTDRIEKEAAHAPRIAPPARGLANFQQIDLPLNVPTDHAWEIVDEDAFPSLTRAVWNANGLRVGVLARSRIGKFIEALPPAEGVRRTQLLASAHPTPILRTPRLRGEATIDLTIPPMAPHEIHVTGGRLQLLARLTRGPGGELVFDLLPHHYVPKLTLKPRGPLQKELDGRIFKQLTLRTHLAAGSMLVVGLYRPWPKPRDRSQRPSMPTLPRDQTPDDQPSSEQPSEAPSVGEKGGAGTSSSQPSRARPAVGGVSTSPGRMLHANSEQAGAALRGGPDLIARSSAPVKQEAKRPAREKPPQAQGPQPSSNLDSSPKRKKLTPADVLDPPPPDATFAKPPPLSNDLGRALFAILRKGHPTQRILLISIEPLNRATPTAAVGNRR